jgi:hypothetical protein
LIFAEVIAINPAEQAGLEEFQKYALGV